MKWKKITIETTTQATDMLSYVLNEKEVEGIEIEDKIPLSEDDKKAMFIDILPELPPDDGVAYISCYVEEDRDLDELQAYIKQELEDMATYMNVGSGKITLGETEDKDWINNWKEFFHTFRVSDRMVIKPTWQDISEYDGYRDDDIVISIDPGTAFGTGSHDTTRLCINALEKHVMNGMNILDVGCGSGILSIAAIKYGAGHALGIDIDKYAIPSTIENRDINGIGEEKFDIVCGNLLDGSDVSYVGDECYDIAVANILADVIIPLSAVIGRHIKPGGLFISSGIINTAADRVRDAIVAAGFTVLEESTSGEWYCFTARKQECDRC